MGRFLMKRLLKRMAVIISAALLCVFSAFESFAAPKAFADETDNLQEEFENINVLDDLKAMTVDGKAFDITDYAFDTTREVQIVSFTEFCYSFYADKQNNFGLYVYIWNPQGLNFVDDKLRNKISFTIGENNESLKEYTLSILNKSEEKGYEGLFYKLKIVLSSEERALILASLNSVSRQYAVRGIKLLQNGQATANAYTVSTTFTYSGYAAGYGSASSTEDTLSCSRSGNEILSLDVHQTYFRPKGTNGQNSYTHDQLMSVYFSIPNKVLDSYDRMSGVKCTWIKAFTDWAYVTGRHDLYEAYLEWIGKTGWIDGDPFLSGSTKFPYGFCASDLSGKAIVSCNYSGESAQNIINRLNYVFWTGSYAQDSADSYSVDREELYNWMLAYNEKYGQAGDKYIKVDYNEYAPFNENLFADSLLFTTEVVVSADEKKSLTDEYLTANWWQKIWHKTDVEYSTTFKDIEAIKKVTAEDMNYSDSALCEKLYIDENDIADFKKFYNLESLKGRTTFLMRFDVGEYQSIEVRQGKPDNDGQIVGFDDGDTNGYVFRENVYLNFNIIHCEFERNNEKIIIPVVANPIDVISSSRAPLYTKSDKEPPSPWEIIIALLCLIILIAIFMPILPSLVSLVIKILMLPFKLIGAIIKGIEKAFHKRE